MRNVINLSGPMGNGIRPKKYFGATRELMRSPLGKSSNSKVADIQKTIVKDEKTV